MEHTIQVKCLSSTPTTRQRNQFGEVREWLNRAVSKSYSAFLANCTNLTKSACLSTVCAEFDFTGFPSFFIRFNLVLVPKW